MSAETERAFLRWVRYATPGQCEYCGHHTHVQAEPFGQQPACFTCWEQVCYGED